MKYILIIWVCSFLEGNQCLPPIEFRTTFNSWYECSRAAHQESVKIIGQMGYKYVNDHHIATRYSCRHVAIL